MVKTVGTVPKPPGTKPPTTPPRPPRRPMVGAAGGLLAGYRRMKDRQALLARHVIRR